MELGRLSIVSFGRKKIPTRDGNPEEEKQRAGQPLVQILQCIESFCN
jgi:hypothetical protein